MTTEYLVRKVKTCDKCNGKGRYYFPHCGVCGWPVTEKEIATLDRNKTMLCGHTDNKLIEEVWCEECEGEGKIEKWVPLQEALRETQCSPPTEREECTECCWFSPAPGHYTNPRCWVNKCKEETR